jgi:hypothetical protein
VTKKPTKRVQITKYEVTTWLNKLTNEPIYGVRVRVTGQGWCGVAVDGKPVFRYSRKEARDYIVGMKKERDKDGFRIKPRGEEIAKTMQARQA